MAGKELRDELDGWSQFSTFQSFTVSNDKTENDEKTPG
jgi:hypothetical protein